jgi:hypothetical protein
MKVRLLTPLVLIGLLAACSSGAAGAPSSESVETRATRPSTTTTVEPTTTRRSTTTSSTSRATSTIVDESTTTTAAAKVGELAAGNRMLMIGDSVLASTSRRYGNTMCQALVPLGWQLELDAESGRFIDFGRRVLRDRFASGWDVVVVMLGNNYGGDEVVFRRELDSILDSVGDLPVLLLTVTEFRPDRAEVNRIVWEESLERDNVQVLDWAGGSAMHPDWLGGDGLHLSESGRVAIALSMADAVGQAPEQLGDCLRTSYTDDTRGPVTGTTVRPTGTARPSGTTRPPTPTTVRSVTPTTAGATSPPATQSPKTDPPATQPPATQPPPPPPPPPPTQPPATQPAPIPPAPTQPAPAGAPPAP